MGSIVVKQDRTNSTGHSTLLEGRQLGRNDRKDGETCAQVHASESGYPKVKTSLCSFEVMCCGPWRRMEKIQTVSMVPHATTTVLPLLDEVVFVIII